MAGEEKCVLSFHQKCYGKDIISWSDDNRISLCTDGGIHILAMQYSPYQLDSTPHFQRQFIPPPLEPCNLTGLPRSEFLHLKSSLSYKKLQPLVLDRALCPFVQGNASSLVYKTACWSPPSADKSGRCVIATLTYDHRLEIYTTGSTRSQWAQVVDLSRLYYGMFKANMANKFTSLDKLKSSVYPLAAVEMSWSPLYNGIRHGQSVSYSLLAIGMKSGHLVIWKVYFPCVSEVDFEFMQTLSLSTSHFTSLAWSKETDESGYLVSGHFDGTIHLCVVGMNDGTVTENKCLFPEPDLLEVTCCCIKHVVEERWCVLVTKEAFIMMFVLRISNKEVTILSSSHTTGNHSMYVTGLTVKGDDLFMSSADGILQRLKLQINETDVNVECVPVSIEYVPSTYTWSMYGATMSNCGIFLATVAMPLQTVDKRKEKKNLKLSVHLTTDSEVLKKKVENYLLATNVSCSEMPDVMELFRHYLWKGQNIVPHITDHLSEPNLLSVPFKRLRLLRFVLIVIKLHIPQVQEGEDNKELLLTEENIDRVTSIICGKHIQESLENLSKSDNLSENDRRICASMVHWVSVHKSRFEDTALLQMLSTVQKMCGEDMRCKCCICDSELSYDKLSASCPNGHKFVLCSMSLLPCDEVPYRTCQVCKNHCLAFDKLSGPTSAQWLTGNKKRCNLCDGLLV